MATAFFALWPQYLFSGSMVTNDVPTAVIGALFTWLLLKLLKLQQPRWPLVLSCVLVIVVGTAIKLNALPLLAPLLATILLVVPPRRAITVIVGIFLLAILILTGLRNLPGILLPLVAHSADVTPAILSSYL